MPPSQSDKPYFIWLPTTYDPATENDLDYRNDYGDPAPEFDRDLGVYGADDNEKPAMPIWGRLLGDCAESVDGIVLGKDGGGEHLDHSIYLYISSSYSPGWVSNQCVQYLTRNDIPAKHQFAGTICLYGMGKALDSQACVDLDCSDLMIALNGLIERRLNMVLGYQYSSCPQLEKKVKGVKVYPGTDDMVFEELSIPRQHPIFDTEPSGICNELGLTLITYISSSVAPGPTDRRRNAALALRAGGKVATAGVAARISNDHEWNLKGMNSVLVVQKDRTAVTAAEVKAAVDACLQEVEDLVGMDGSATQE